MMTTSDKILEAREKRYNRILKLQEKHQTVMTVKVNYPGKDKNDNLVYLILNSFNVKQFSFTFQDMDKYISDDGPYYIIGLNEDAELLKKITIEFEEKHSLGRFLDIDVYSNKEPLSREHKRKCYICGEPAHECIRSKKHSFNDLEAFIRDITIAYYSKQLDTFIDESMMIELDLDPKFGLVTKKTSGSHDDMNYQLMLKAKEAIIPYFIDMFKLSIKIDNMANHIADLRTLGIQAEIAMFKATNKVNAYKGLIFHLGLIVSVYGYYISRSLDKSIIEVIKDTAYLFFNLDDLTQETFGKIAYKKHQIKGAKGEALLGYPHVKEALRLYNDETDALKVLVNLICHIQDTNLLKRSKNLDFYKKVKNMFCKLDVNNQDEVNQLSQFCIDHRLSFGGSADLLIVTIFIKKLMENHNKIAFI